jgi:hypothetical protein
VPLVVAVDDGQVLTADLFSGDLFVGDPGTPV